MYFVCIFQSVHFISFVQLISKLSSSCLISLFMFSFRYILKYKWKPKLPKPLSILYSNQRSRPRTISKYMLIRLKKYYSPWIFDQLVFPLQWKMQPAIYFLFMWLFWTFCATLVNLVFFKHPYFYNMTVKRGIKLERPFCWDLTKEQILDSCIGKQGFRFLCDDSVCVR